MNSPGTRTSSSTVSLSDLPMCPLLKPYMSSYEVSRFIQKCQKERDDAFRREESARDKLKHLEATTRSHIQDLKKQLKEATSESKGLHRTVKKLRTELGLEGNPRFKGKMTKDIIKELHENEDQCSRLREDNNMLSVQLREMIPIIAQCQEQKAGLQEQVRSLEAKVQDLLKETNRISQSLQESQREKEDLEKVNLMLKKSMEDGKKVTSRSVQTITSIPVNLQNNYKRNSRDTSSSSASQVIVDRKKVSLISNNTSPVTDGSIQKAYYGMVRDQT